MSDTLKEAPREIYIFDDWKVILIASGMRFYNGQWSDTRGDVRYIRADIAEHEREKVMKEGADDLKAYALMNQELKERIADLEAACNAAWLFLNTTQSEAGVAEWLHLLDNAVTKLRAALGTKEEE